MNLRNNICKIGEGGRLRLPSLFGASQGPLRLLRAVALATVCLTVGRMAQAQGPQTLRQMRQERRADRRAQAIAPQNTKRPVARPLQNAMLARRQMEKVALDLLRKMIRPTADYTGEMVTQVAAQNNFPLQQTIRGDKQGRTLVMFLNGNLAGDILLVTPGGVRNYHRSTGIVDVADWPTEWDGHEKRMLAAIRSGFYTARAVGTEQVAGRQASIVELLPVVGAGEPGRPHFKFWIDTETGIQLKNEKSDAMGRVLSHRYLTSIATGPNVALKPKDFNLPILNRAPVRPLFPQDTQYHSLEQAQGHLPFTPVVPSTLPNGFQLSDVWIFPGGNNQAQFVLLRFTDRVTSFSLYERVIPRSDKPARPSVFNHHIERWRVSTARGDIEATYTGMLTPGQVQDLYSSLR